jgi:hypothetical protein
MATVPEEIQAIVKLLSPDEQRRVLEFARSISRPRGIDLSSLPRSTPPPGTPASALPHFDLSDEDAEAMERAIMEDCERIFPDEY